MLKTNIPGSRELLAVGNISIRDGKYFAHVHAFLGDPDKNLRGGHLVSGKVSVTVEGVIQENRDQIGRKIDPKVNYPVWEI